MRIRPALYGSVSMIPTRPRSTLFPYTTLFRSKDNGEIAFGISRPYKKSISEGELVRDYKIGAFKLAVPLVPGARSEEHTSELQSRRDLVCRLLLEKKKHHSPPALPFRRGTDRR